MSTFEPRTETDVKLGTAEKERRDGGMNDDRAAFEEAAPTAGSVAQMIGTKNLLIAIVTMPFVFLVVVMAIIGIFGKPGSDRGAVSETPASPVASVTLEQPAVSGQRAVIPIGASAEGLSSAITAPEGAQVGAMSLDGDRLAVRIDSADGSVIVIYDLVEGAVVQTIPITEANAGLNSAGP